MRPSSLSRHAHPRMLAEGGPMKERRRRPYQQEIVDAAVAKANAGGDRGLVVIPTGAGKTFTFTEALWELDRLPQFTGKRILVVAHQDEIVRQNARELENRFPDEVGVLTEGQPDPKTRVVSATVQTLMAQLNTFPWDEFALVTTDEAHHYVPENEWFKVLRRLGFFGQNNEITSQEGTRFLLGFTATPDRDDGQSLTDVFGEEGLIYTKDINYFTSHGFLRHPHCVRVGISGLGAGGVPLQGFEVWKGMSLDQKAALLVQLINSVPELKRGDAIKRGIVFLTSTEEVLGLETRLKAAGISSVAILGQTENRAEKLKAFREGKFRLMLNIGVAIEGFDAPGTEAVFLFGSDETPRGRTVQMMGRALRIDAEHPDREDAYVVDLWGLTARHNIFMSGTVAYFWSRDKVTRDQDSRDSAGISRSGHRETASFRPATTHIAIAWDTYKIEAHIPIDDNAFAVALAEELKTDEDIRRLAYRVKVSEDVVRDWRSGRTIPSSREMNSLLPILRHNRKLAPAYKATTAGLRRAYVVAQLKRLNHELGQTPLLTEALANGIPGNWIRELFDNRFNDALEAAGLEPTRLVHELTLDKVKEIVSRVGQRLAGGGNFTSGVYDRLKDPDDPSASTLFVFLRNKGGPETWGRVVQNLGFTYKPPKRYTTEDIQEAVATVGNGIEDERWRLDRRIFNDLARVLDLPIGETIIRVAGIPEGMKWPDAVAAIERGLPRNPKEYTTTRQEAIELLQRAARELDTDLRFLEQNAFEVWRFNKGAHEIPGWVQLANLINGNASNNWKVARIEAAKTTL